MILTLLIDFYAMLCLFSKIIKFFPFTLRLVVKYNQNDNYAKA